METELSVDTPRAATRIGALNREAILEAALAAFSVHGFRGTTIDEIAARVLRSGGRVRAVRSTDLPDGAPVAAVLRFPLPADLV